MEFQEHTSPVPSLPEDPKRITIAVERKSFDRAKSLKIDVHALLRIRLDEAIAIKEQQKKERQHDQSIRNNVLHSLSPFNNDSTDKTHQEEAYNFIDALGCGSDDSNSPTTDYSQSTVTTPLDRAIERSRAGSDGLGDD